MAPGRRDALILAGAGVAAAAAGFLAGAILLGRSDGEGEAGLMAARLPDLSGKPRQLSEWRGRVIVCNFWATWCAPCREEIPLLVAARDRYAASGVEIVGIAIDSAAKVADFARTFKITYPVLLSEAGGVELMRKLGNAAGGLPYTVFFDREGKVAHRQLGALRQPELDKVLGSMTRG